MTNWKGSIDHDQINIETISQPNHTMTDWTDLNIFKN